MQRIAILASGAGSNAKAIIEHFNRRKVAKVALVISNRKNAGVLEVAGSAGIVWKHLDNRELESSLLEILSDHQIDFIVLAGFLKKVPSDVIRAYDQRIVNIHPALLPQYGGRGMYGKKVHEAVFEAREKESGITIHFVNENYDEGKIIFQEKVAIDENDNPAQIEAKIRKLEHQLYPEIIEKLLS